RQMGEGHSRGQHQGAMMAHNRMILSASEDRARVFRRDRGHCYHHPARSTWASGMSDRWLLWIFIARVPGCRFWRFSWALPRLPPPTDCAPANGGRLIPLKSICVAGPAQQTIRCLTPEAVADLDKTFSPISRTTNSTCERVEHESTPLRLKWRLQ